MSRREQVSAESEFLGMRRAKVWTYFFLLVLLTVGVLVANFAIKNPAIARDGVHKFMGMPPWAFPSLGAAVGALVYWVGLKVETDWPEALGALLIAGSLAAGEVLIGWDKFAVGGIAAIPYVLPFAVFLGLLGFGLAKSR